jgi:hypothetical protein
MRRQVLFIILTALFCCLSLAAAKEKKVFFRENFETLDDWRPLLFPKIKNHTEYRIERSGDETYLKAVSRASASGLVLKKEFDVREYPFLRWKWKVDNLYAKAGRHEKAGDDYPIRIYVIFRFDPDKASFFEKVKYELAKKLYGEDPPDSSLNYVWSSRDTGGKIYDNPYSDRAKMVVMEQGAAHVGKWMTEETNMLDDYRKAFGIEPPASASIAIMNDSDDTGEYAVSYVDFLEVYGQ